MTQSPLARLSAKLMRADLQRTMRPKGPSRRELARRVLAGDMRAAQPLARIILGRTA